jgi:transposase InsO family protein
VFEIPCWNGDAVQIAFAIDTDDREILAWTASPRGIGGIATRDLMLLAVERRFSALRTPQPAEWLADNGSCFTAHGPSPSPTLSASSHASRRSGARIERHCRSLREDRQAQLCPSQPETRRRHRHSRARPLVRG